MKKIIDELINSSISGVDVYRWKDSTWLIFTDETRWVVELTDEGTLWYNYKFFNDIFKYVSMTVGKEMEEYVIQWANDYFYKGVEKTEERGKNYGNEFELDEVDDTILDNYMFFVSMVQAMWKNDCIAEEKIRMLIKKRQPGVTGCLL